MNIKLFIIFLYSIHSIYSLNIVFHLTLIGKSHLNFVNALIKLLQNKGHSVDLIVGRLNSATEVSSNHTCADRFLLIEFPDNNSPWQKMSHLKQPFMDYQDFDHLKMWNITSDLCKISLESNEAIKFLTEKKYDIFLASDYDFCGYVLGHKAQIKSIASYTATNLLFNQVTSLGLPSPVSVVMDNLDPKASLTLMGKMTALWKRAFYFLYFQDVATAKNDELVRSIYGKDFPSTLTLYRNSDLVFVNSNEFVEKPRTISHKVVYIGGSALPKAKALSSEFDRILNLRSKGTVIFSFGTQVPSSKIPYYIKQSFVEAIKHFPEYTFVWKYDKQPEDGDIFDKSDNLVLVNWFPQTDLLHDSRVVAFITHMGLNSFLEAAYGGVPLIAIPLFADQYHNTRCAISRGMAVEVSKGNRNPDILYNALKEILENSKYRTQAKRLSNMLRGNAEKMQKRFIEAVEFAGEHGSLHQIFNIPDAELDVFTYYCVDVILVSLICIIGFLFISYIVIKYICYIVYHKFKVQKSKQL